MLAASQVLLWAEAVVRLSGNRRRQTSLTPTPRRLKVGRDLSLAEETGKLITLARLSQFLCRNGYSYGHLT